MTDLDRLTAGLADRYALQRELGRGGMATVYLADDLKHHRQVAVKVLHPELAAVLGAERFLREIEIAAGLTHPHILPLHDSGQVDSLLYYVMPFVDGESLRDRLKREQQLSLEDTIHIAHEVADGLSYAHAQGVVHRDIKPENILLSGNHALIADFGIAKAVSAASGTRLTETGLSLGTPEYMSPEQASGSGQVDARSDQYALGSVVYEMLAGEPPHTGPNTQAIIAKVLTQPVPKLTAVRDTVPPQVEYAVTKALGKLPADRFATVKQFAEALHQEHTSGWTPTLTRDPSPPPARRTVLAWQAVAAVAVVAAITAVWAPWRGVPPAGQPVVRFTVRLPPGRALDLDALGSGSSIAVAPNGLEFVYVASEEGTTRLYRRLLNDTKDTPIVGTEGARAPFFSPDGNWVGFFAGGSMKKVSLLGGRPQVIAELPGMRTASWGTDGTIVFGARDRGADDHEGLQGVPQDGGVIHEVSSPDFFPTLGQEFHIAPDVLPGGQAVLFTVWGIAADSFGVAVRELDGDDQRILIRGGIHPRYLSSGHIAYLKGTDLFVVPFDVDRLEVHGTAVPILEGVGSGPRGNALYHVSRNGTLVFVPATSGSADLSLVWVDHTGGMEPTGVEGAWIQSPRVSPDGEQILFQRDVSFWTFDIDRKVTQRLTDDSGQEWWAVWNPDATNVLFNSLRPSGDLGLYQVAADASAPPALLETGLIFTAPQSVSRELGILALLGSNATRAGSSAATPILDPATGMDVWIIDLRGDHTAHSFLNTQANEFHPAFSDDGRWLAYASDQSGREEVYVRPYPGPGRIVQVSTGGGSEPLWSPSREELYYRSMDGRRVIRVSFRTEPEFAAQAPQPLFQGPFVACCRWGRVYDITPDGERFLMIRDAENRTALREFEVVLNWFEELREKLAARDGQ